MTPANPAEISRPLMGLFDSLTCNRQQKGTKNARKGEAGGYQAVMGLYQ